LADRSAPQNAAVTLRFDEFGWQCLESEAGGDGQSLDELIVRAVAYFDAELRTTRRALLAPWCKPSGHGTSREIEFEPSAVSERLGREASRQGIPLERLLEHASLFYIADVDAHRHGPELDQRRLERGASTMVQPVD
jgi:hypothetical protein